MTKTLLATVIAALALLAAGCGGSDESTSASPTDEWADGFCTAITTWTDSLTSVTDQFNSPSSLSTSALEDAANDVKSSTQTLVDDLKALGAPDTESGQAVKDSLDSLSSTLDDEATKIQSEAEGVSGLTGLPGAITSITTSLSAMATAFSSALEAIQNADAKGELQTALEDSPSCAEISS
jgi:hypothetical protein